jgi:hypothetical protein
LPTRTCRVSCTPSGFAELSLSLTSNREESRNKHPVMKTNCMKVPITPNVMMRGKYLKKLRFFRP